MYVRNCLLWCAATIVIATSKDASAQQLHDEGAFFRCDGYAAPTKKGDSLTTTTATGFFFEQYTSTVDQRRNSSKLGSRGAAACDRALANPVLKPEYAVRKANLLQAKAAHLIASEQYDSALAILRQSDESGETEALFDQSIGQGNRALKAFALYALGRKTDADSILQRMEQRRPWAVSQRQLALIIRLRFEDDAQKQMTQLQQVAPLYPAARNWMYWAAVFQDDWNAVIRIAPTIRFFEPKNYDGWKIEGELIAQNSPIVEKAKVSGALAYAQLAVGDRNASAATMARATEEAQAAMAPVPPAENGQNYKSKALLQHERRKAAGGFALQILNGWNAALDLRTQAPRLLPSQIVERLEAGQLPVTVATDVIANAKVQSSKDETERAGYLAALRQRKKTDWQELLTSDIAKIVAMLPRPETSSMNVSYRHKGAFWGAGNGFSVQRGEPENANTIRFSDSRGVLAAIDEGALFAAANFARESGKDSFIVDARMPIQRTVEYRGGFRDGEEQPTGYEVQLVLRVVNAADVPVPERSLAIDATTILNALNGKFPSRTR